VIDTVNGVLAERRALDRGFSSSLVLSGFGHFMLLAIAVLAALLAPRKPPLQVIDGFAVVLPRGGGGTPNVAPATAPSAPEPPAPEVAPQPAPPPQILKPPKEEPKKGLPELDAKRTKPSKEKTPPTWVDPSASRTQGKPGASAASATPGLEFAPAGPGIPGGADSGDWYLAGVQRKIWMLWTQQVKEDTSQQVSVQFTILADGSVTNVQVTRSSGVALLDMAAQRSVMSAAPFRPLPKDYETDQITIQANFKPNP
jgi:protein TonB